MKINKKLLLGHFFNTILLVATGAWYGADGGWEPVVVFLTFLAAYTSSGYFLLKSVLKDEVQTSIDDLLNDEQLISALSAIYSKLIELDSESVPIEGLLAELSRSQKNAVLAFLYSFSRLGLITINDNQNIKFVSERASSFLTSSYLSLKKSSIFIGDWTAEGCSNEEAKKMCSILTSVENQRISIQGLNAMPSRKVQSSIVIVKGTFQGKDRFLMQWSDAWGEGYYWFIGGIREYQDASLKACAKRELGEELGLQPAAITSVNLLGTVQDKRISSRVGAYTEYEYSIYSVALDSRNEKVDKIYEEIFTIDSHIAWSQYHRKSRWHTWDEISQDPQLRRDASNILSFIENYGPTNIPVSSPIEIRGVANNDS